MGPQVHLRPLSTPTPFLLLHLYYSHVSTLWPYYSTPCALVFVIFFCSLVPSGLAIKSQIPNWNF